MSITITIQADDAGHARREMQALLGQRGNHVVFVDIDEPSARTVAQDDVTISEMIDAKEAETAAEDADGVELPAAATEPPKRRGRPRKDTAFEKIKKGLDEAVEIVASGQIDIEDVIASQIDDTAVHDSSGDVYQDLDVTPPAPQPEDPTAGWTTQDARNAGRALLDRAPDVDTGNRKLAATLVPFGVQQVKALQPDQIEAFVIATQKAVF